MDAFIGTIMLFAGNFAPLNWLVCNGQILPINQNQALFSILGTTYGGDGVTNFALPNLNSATLDAAKGSGNPLFIICTNGIFPSRA
jgi:microcystin-dependent protein